MKNLSKSKLLSCKQCPKRLWLSVNSPELESSDNQSQRILTAGTQVGELARLVFDKNNEGKLVNPIEDGFENALKETKALLKDDKPIFEAAFQGGGAFVLADVMLPDTSDDEVKWDMIEVKSSTDIKNIYYDDVAVQKYSAEQAGLELEKILLACIENSWVYQEEGKYQGIFKTFDLTEQASERQASVKTLIKEANEVLNYEVEPEIEIGEQCFSPYACGFYEYCSRDLVAPEFPVQWLSNIRTKKLKEHIKLHHVKDMRDVPDELLNPLQLRVKQHTLDDSIYFDSSEAKKAVEHYPFPIYFLDFETINLAIPIWKGTHPYEQITFQYSVHIISDGIGLEHSEFLDISGDDPSGKLVNKLLDDCGENGAIFVYNAGFEKGRIRELAARYPSFKDQLLELNSRIVDLLPIAKENYYHPAQKGSWSIKRVLEAIAPELSYESLNGVKDGGMAMEAYVEAISADTSDERKEVLREQLLRYCELDSLAMVKLWQFFSGKALG